MRVFWYTLIFWIGYEQNLKRLSNTIKIALENHKDILILEFFSKNVHLHSNFYMIKVLARVEMLKEETEKE